MASDGIVLERVAAGVAPKNDPFVADSCARIADRLLNLGDVLGHPDGDRRLTADDMSILTAHHDQKASVRCTGLRRRLEGDAADGRSTGLVAHQ